MNRPDHDNGWWGRTDHADKLAYVRAVMELWPQAKMGTESDCDPLRDADLGGEA